MYLRSIFKSAAIVGSSAFIVGCGGGSSTPVTELGYNGVLVDTGVAGVKWECGGVMGTTLADGGFGECPAGSDVTFSVGNVVLGTLAPTADYIFTPQDIVGVDRTDTANTDVTGMSALLLSLDSDGDPSNGIEITPEVIAALDAVITTDTLIEDLLLTDTTIDTLVTDIIAEDDTLTIEAVTIADAEDHLIETATDIEDGVIETPDQPVDESTN